MDNTRTVPRIVVALGVPALAAIVLTVVITAAVGWPWSQAPGVAIAIFAVLVVPWMAFLLLRRIRQEERDEQ